MQKLFPSFVNANLALVKEQIVPQIGNPAVEILAGSILTKLVETSYLLVDENPDNKAQITALWGSFTSDASIANAFETLFVSGVSKIEDARLKESLLLLTPEIVKTLIAATDTNPKTGKQIEDIWKSFVKGPSFLQLVFTNLDWVLQRINLPTWLKDFIARYLKK